METQQMTFDSARAALQASHREILDEMRRKVEEKASAIDKVNDGVRDLDRQIKGKQEKRELLVKKADAQRASKRTIEELLEKTEAWSEEREAVQRKIYDTLQFASSMGIRYGDPEDPRQSPEHLRNAARMDELSANIEQARKDVMRAFYGKAL
jgi:septal ring factor EnvC (AmiA/AmiB activator)